MRASLILIGDELVSGKVHDTNGFWLAQQLSLRGIHPRRIYLIEDDKQSLDESLRQCWKASDMIIVTGGLGPTPDDRTKNILSQFFSVPLEHHESAEKMVLQHYSRKNRPVPTENTYHLLPKGFAPLFNPCGLAPGLFRSEEGKVLACLPGVPREMRAMAEQELFPRLETASPADILTVRTYGVTEEDIFLKLCPGLWERLSAFGKVASLPRNTGIDLHITLSAPRKNELKDLLKDSPLNNHIWQFGTLSLPALILKKIGDKNLTLSLAESATGGLMSSMLTDTPGASRSFMGSLVAYDNDIKKRILSVPEEHMGPPHQAISVETARSMAEGVQKLFNTDLAVALSGLAGPPGVEDVRPVGTLVLGTASSHTSSQAREYQFSGNREQLKERFALTGLFALLPLIEGV